MKVVIIGATGATGKALINCLLNDDRITKILALVRNANLPSNPKLEQKIIDFENLESATLDLDADVAISCLGTTLKDAGSKEKQWKIDFDYQLNFAKKCKERNIKKFVLVSSIGSNPNSRFFYTKMKGKLEEKILELKFNETIIFRPAGLIRPNTDRLGEKISIKILTFLNTLSLLKNYKPIKVSDLAKAIQNSLYTKNKTINILKLGDIFKLKLFKLLFF